MESSILPVKIDGSILFRWLIRSISAWHNLSCFAAAVAGSPYVSINATAAVTHAAIIESKFRGDSVLSQYLPY